MSRLFSGLLAFALVADIVAFAPGMLPRVRGNSAARSVRERARQCQAVVIDISSTEEFNEALEKAGDALVVVDYSTSWCGPCKIIAPKFDEFSEQYTNVSFLKVSCALRKALKATCCSQPC